jgi:hypothetical protein
MCISTYVYKYYLKINAKRCVLGQIFRERSADRTEEGAGAALEATARGKRGMMLHIFEWSKVTGAALTV